MVIWLGLQIPIMAQGARDLLKIADEHYEKEQFNSAAQYYQVAVALQPHNPEINYRLAQCYRSVFDYPLAANYYQKTIELDNNSFPLAPFYLAQMEKSMGNFKQAKDLLEQFIITNQKNTSIPAEERAALLAQAEIEMEGSVWAIEQLGKSWRDMGFRLLQEPVNSINNDYAAVPSDAQGSITITSGRKGTKGSLVDNRFGEYFTDNLRFKNQEEDTWIRDQTSDHFDRTNTKFNDGVGTYNTAGDKYYFTSCYEGNAFCKLYVIYRENGSWRNPTLLNKNVNAPGYDNKHPTLTSGGDTLIFVSNRPGGSGGNDLWYSVLENEEDWQPPRPMPGNINTSFNEVSPYCLGDLLFFSSDGHAGIGGVDIFMVEKYLRQDSRIQNLGTPFNSGYDDSFFVLGQNMGYLSSNRPGGKGKFDIYAFNIPPEDEKDVTRFLQETADGSYLRSRIRDRDASNFFAARDEDQFYYDNLSRDEKAKFDRILSAKQSSDGQLDLASLSKEDVKYYNKLDIGTKAMIERLALRKTMELEGLNGTSQMSYQQKLDWEYYQNIDELEKETVDRILNVRVEGRRRALSKLNSQERAYSSDPVNKERIERKVQLRSLRSLSEDLQQKQRSGYQQYQQNQQELGPQADQDHQYAESRAASYTAAIEALGPSHSFFYRSLSPVQRDNIHQSALRQVAVEQPKIDQSQLAELLSNIGLVEDPVSLSTYQESGAQQKAEQVRTAIQDNLHQNIATSNVSAADHIEREMAVQQMMLKQHLEDLNYQESEARYLQEQLEQYIAAQEQAPDPVMEARIVDEYHAQLAGLPFLTPKDSYYFNSLSLGHWMRLERLAIMVDDQTRDRQQTIVENESLTYQQATDQWFYLELDPDEREMVDQLINNGWNFEPSSSPELHEFVQGLNPLEKERIDRMMGNQQLHSDLQTDQSIANTQEPVQEPLSIMGRTEIFFDYDQHTLRPEARKALQELQQYLKQTGKPVTLIIEGHTDNTGSKSYNQKLAQHRTQTVSKIFEQEKDLIKVSIRSLGEGQPAFDNQSPAGRQMNRRVELKISGLSYQTNLRTYLVRPDVTLSMIAAATGYSETEIISWNGPISKNIRAYQPIRLPAEMDSEALKSVLFIPKESPEKQEDRSHTVAEGENIFKLAREYNTTVQELEDINQTSSDDLTPGQKIRVK